MTKKDDKNSEVDAQDTQATEPAVEATGDSGDNTTTDSAAPEVDAAEESAVTKSEAAETPAETTPAAKSTEANTSEKKQSAEPKTDKPKSGQPRSWLNALAFILAIAALLVSALSYHKLQTLAETNNTLNQKTVSLDNKLNSTANTAETASTEMERLRNQIDSQQKKVDEFQDRLTRATKQISQFGSNKRKDWLLAEVEYLLRLANQRVQMERSPIGALALLKAGDAILQETDDVSIYNVRKALAKDIAALEAVPKLDLDGTFVKLLAINERVAELKMLPIPDHKMPATLDEIAAETLDESWQQNVKQSWDSALDKLGRLVVIQQRDEPIEPLLSPEQTYFLQQNLHLMLEQAQLSLLQGQQNPYNASLDKAKDWIGTYFENDTNTAAILRSIDELRSINVAPELPDISGSLKALKGYLAEVHKAEEASS